MANSIDRVKQDIRKRLDELEAERDQLLRAFAALGGGAPAKKRGRPPGSGSASGRRRGSGHRAPRGQRREQVLKALEGNDLGPSGIAREIGGVNPTQISGILRQLAAEGRVARTAGGKWRLTPAAEFESGGAASGGQAGAPGSGGGSDSGS